LFLRLKVYQGRLQRLCLVKTKNDVFTRNIGNECGKPSLQGLVRIKRQFMKAHDPRFEDNVADANNICHEHECIYGEELNGSVLGKDA
jgi:hypothetical protein